MDFQTFFSLIGDCFGPVHFFEVCPAVKTSFLGGGRSFTIPQVHFPRVLGPCRFWLVFEFVGRSQQGEEFRTAGLAAVNHKHESMWALICWFSGTWNSSSLPTKVLFRLQGRYTPLRELLKCFHIKSLPTRSGAEPLVPGGSAPGTVPATLFHTASQLVRRSGPSSRHEGVLETCPIGLLPHTELHRGSRVKLPLGWGRMERTSESEGQNKDR